MMCIIEFLGSPGVTSTAGDLKYLFLSLKCSLDNAGKSFIAIYQSSFPCLFFSKYFLACNFSAFYILFS